MVCGRDPTRALKLFNSGDGPQTQCNEVPEDLVYCGLGLHIDASCRGVGHLRNGSEVLVRPELLSALSRFIIMRCSTSFHASAPQRHFEPSVKKWSALLRVLPLELETDL